MKEFANNLKRLRNERNITQSQLAQISCISVKTIQNYEQNRDGRAPTLDNLMLLADIFEVTPYNLYYGGDKEMSTNSLYMSQLLMELKSLSFNDIKEIHDSDAIDISLPKFSISESVITELKNHWNDGINFPERGLYKNYIEQTITRYAQNRQSWKKKFKL